MSKLEVSSGVVTKQKVFKAFKLGVVAHSFNPRTQAGCGGTLI